MNVDTVTIQSTCILCTSFGAITIKSEDFDRYKNGAMVQDAFPYLTAGQREFYFLSHWCEACYDSLFGEDEEEDD